MSFAWTLALGFWLLVSGASGYERYMLEKRTARAVIDIIVMVVGVCLIAQGFDSMAEAIRDPAP